MYNTSQAILVVNKINTVMLRLLFLCFLFYDSYLLGYYLTEKYDTENHQAKFCYYDKTYGIFCLEKPFY